MLIGDYTGEYTGSTLCGFVNGNRYKINIDKNVYGYTVSGLENLTDKTDTKAGYMSFASEKSLRRCWEID